MTESLSAEDSRPLSCIPAVIAFIDRTNHGDLEGLLALMSEGHTLQVLDEPRVSGKDVLGRVWQSYFDAFPTYLIHPGRITQSGNLVAVLGHTTGSHLGLPDEQESKIEVIWTASLESGRLVSWTILEDTPQVRHNLGLDI
jgi:ketosteroid isomerase-like protein